jgi:hypothetical protein
MELLVASWTVRLALVGMLVVGWISLSAGIGVLDTVIRAALTAFVLLFAGRQILGFLETPEQKIARMRARRAGKAKKKGDA